MNYKLSRAQEKAPFRPVLVTCNFLFLTRALFDCRHLLKSMLAATSVLVDKSPLFLIVAEFVANGSVAIFAVFVLPDVVFVEVAVAFPVSIDTPLPILPLAELTPGLAI